MNSNGIYVSLCLLGLRMKLQDLKEQEEFPDLST